jgi:hypothetical protein
MIIFPLPRAYFADTVPMISLKNLDTGRWSVPSVKVRNWIPADGQYLKVEPCELILPTVPSRDNNLASNR